MQFFTNLAKQATCWRELSFFHMKDFDTFKCSKDFVLNQVPNNKGSISHLSFPEEFRD